MMNLRKRNGCHARTKNPNKNHSRKKPLLHSSKKQPKFVKEETQEILSKLICTRKATGKKDLIWLEELKKIAKSKRKKRTNHNSNTYKKIQKLLMNNDPEFQSKDNTYLKLNKKWNLNIINKNKRSILLLK